MVSEDILNISRHRELSRRTHRSLESRREDSKRIGRVEDCHSLFKSILWEQDFVQEQVELEFNST